MRIALLIFAAISAIAALPTIFEQIAGLFKKRPPPDRD
jgi:hypothetical protein